MTTTTEQAPGTCPNRANHLVVLRGAPAPSERIDPHDGQLGYCSECACETCDWPLSDVALGEVRPAGGGNSDAL